MSKRKAPKGCYWRGETLWGRLIVAGREIRWSLRTDDAAVAKRRREARRKREIAASHYGDDRKTWDDAVVAWGEHITANVGPETAKRYGVSLGQIAPHLRGLYVDEIDKTVIKDIIRDRRKKGASNATIKRDLTALSSVLEFCEDEDWIDSNPALARTRKIKERRDPIILPVPDHIARVIRRAPGHFAGLIEAALLTGCRLSELVWLKRARLDFKARQITIVGKGNKLRVIDMHDAYDVLAKVPAYLREPWVFWHGDGLPYKQASSRFAALVKVARILAQQEGAEFRSFRFHDLRHRFAVDFLKKGLGSLYDLKQHLGHGSVKVTEIYLDYLTPEEARQAKERHGTNPGTATTV